MRDAPDENTLRREAQAATARGALGEACALWGRLATAAPERVEYHFNLGDVLERAGRAAEAAAAYLAACRLAPEQARLALVAATALQAAGREADAAVMCALADGRDPSLLRSHADPRQNPLLRERAARGDRLLRAHYAALHAQSVAEIESTLPEPRRLDRIRGAIWVQTHPEPFAFRNPLQQPGIFYVPGLEASELTPRSRFAWAGALEAATGAIRAEYLAAIAGGTALAPYVESDVKDPRWESLRGRAAWSSLHLYKSAREEPAARLFPRTLAAIAGADVFRVAHERPMEVFFSRLAPGTHIPPHCGVSNHRVTVHLPLIVPSGCAIRVGGQTCQWREGEILAFDDSFEHEAWNRGRSERVVLIFETFHPDLDAAERQAIEHSYARRGEWLAARRIPG